MTKKIEINEVDLIISTVNERVNDAIDYMKEFKREAEKKQDNTRKILKEDISKIDKRLARLEEKNEILSRHQFQINSLQNDMTNLCTEFQNHIKYHNANDPKLAVNKFQTITMWTIFGIILTGMLTKFLGIWDKIINFILNKG